MMTQMFGLPPSLNNEYTPPSCSIASFGTHPCGLLECNSCTPTSKPSYNYKTESSYPVKTSTNGSDLPNDVQKSTSMDKRGTKPIKTIQTVTPTLQQAKVSLEPKNTALVPNARHVRYKLYNITYPAEN